MFYLLFGNYLVERNAVSKTDYLAIKHKVRESDINLGLIAVSEGLLTQAQSDEINAQCACMDKNFGDIAIDKGYLNDAQLENTYLHFVQALIDQRLLTLDEITNYLKDYQSEKGYTDDQMATLKFGDQDAIIPIITGISSPLHKELISQAIRNLISYIDSDICIIKSCITNEYEFKNLAIQSATGDHNIHLGFSGDEESLVQIASIFAYEEFTEIDADSYDAICEFINCINGLFASKLSEDDIEIDMLPPFYYTNKKMICDNLTIVTVTFKEYTFDLVISIDSPVEYVL